jgi:uncharacterized protein (DUF1330 family)
MPRRRAALVNAHRGRIALAFLICLSVMVAAHAQPVSKAKPAFYVAEFVITDRVGMRPYSERVESTFAPFGGRYVSRGGKIDALEGDAPKGGIVIIQFDSMEKARAWYDSPAYAELKPIRHKNAKSRVYILEGLPD